MKVKRGLFLAVFLPSLVAAQSCPVVDYVEVKDWPVETVERAYCADYAVMAELINKQYEATKRSMAAVYAIDPYLARCNKQMDLYTRVLANRFNRKAPSCKPPEK